jgi:hypothetical protein
MGGVEVFLHTYLIKELHEANDLLHALAVWRGRGGAVTHWTGVWLDPSTSIGALKRKLYLPLPGNGQFLGSIRQSLVFVILARSSKNDISVAVVVGVEVVVVMVVVVHIITCSHSGYLS